MPTYLPTDGFLRQGADVLEALGRPDGILFTFGPDTGTPAVIYDSGTVTSTASFAADETLADSGATATTASLSAVQALADTATVTSICVLTGEQALSLLLAGLQEAGASPTLIAATAGAPVLTFSTRAPVTAGVAAGGDMVQAGARSPTLQPAAGAGIVETGTTVTLVGA